MLYTIAVRKSPPGKSLPRKISPGKLPPGNIPLGKVPPGGLGLEIELGARVCKSSKPNPSNPNPNTQGGLFL